MDKDPLNFDPGKTAYLIGPRNYSTNMPKYACDT